MAWYEFKLFLEHASGFSLDAMHVIAGVCLQLAVAALLRVRLSSPVPWLVVLAVELANEWVDFHSGIWPDGPMLWGECAKDVLMTMFLPAVILLAARYRPRLFAD